MSRVEVVGHLCVDLRPQIKTMAFRPGQLAEVGPLAVSLGGSVANTGYALATLGHRVDYAARVGADDLGAIAAEHLARSGLHGAPTTTQQAATSYSVVLEPDGADRAFWHHVGANALFDGTEAAADADIVHVGYPSLLPALVAGHGKPLRRLLERIRRCGGVSSVDLAVVDPTDKRDWAALLQQAMPLIDIVTPSADDLRSALHAPNLVANELVDLLLDWGAGVAVVSDGAQGLWLGAASVARLRASGPVLSRLADTWGDHRTHQQSRRLRRRLTTNGAGDAATAGMLSGILCGESPDAALSRAADTAALAIEGGLSTTHPQIKDAP